MSTSPFGSLTPEDIKTYAKRAGESIAKSNISYAKASHAMRSDCVSFFKSHGFPVHQLPDSTLSNMDQLAKASILVPPDAPAPKEDSKDSAPGDEDDLQLFSILPDWSASCWGCVIGIGVIFAAWNVAATVATGGLGTLIADTAFVGAVAAILGVSAATTASAMAMIGSFAVGNIIVDVLCGAIGACKDEDNIVLPKVGTYETSIQYNNSGWVEKGVHDLSVIDGGKTITCAGVTITTGNLDKNGTFSWSNQPGNQRSGCPINASIVFANEGNSFSGTCQFDGEGPVQFQGTFITT